MAERMKRPLCLAPGTAIRPYAAADRPAVREICCRTAFRNAGSDRFFEDREVFADFGTRYYTDYRPEDVVIVEQEGEVIGYLLGCFDHAHYLRVMAWRIVPACIARALWRLASRRYRQPQTRAYLRHMILRGGVEAPPVDTRKYPAHYHCNILRKGYGQGLYTQLVLEFLDRLEARGVTALHGNITESAEGGAWEALSATCPDGEAVYRAEVATQMFQAVTGDMRPMVNRVWGESVERYRIWITWLRTAHRL